MPRMLKRDGYGTLRNSRGEIAYAKPLSSAEVGRRCQAMAPEGERPGTGLAPAEVSRRLDAYDRASPNESTMRDWSPRTGEDL
jgi:hypothetical protein